MEPLHEENVQAATTTCTSFLERLHFLSEAMFESLDDVDDEDTLVPPLPQYFKTNHDDRETFLFVVAHEFRFRSWRHQTILSQYRDILRSSVYRDLWSLQSAEMDRDHFLAVRRWQSWEVVEARWETKTGVEVMRVCHEMWTALQGVAAAALEYEARAGPCKFNLLEERGVARRGALTLVQAESSASWITGYLGGILHRRGIRNEMM